MKPPSSPDWMSPALSGLISLNTRSSDSALSRPSRRNSGLKPISSASPLNATGGDSLAAPISGARAAASTDPSLSRVGAAALGERGRLDGRAVGVRRDHPEVPLRGGDEDAGEMRSRLVARGGPRYTADRLDEGARGYAHDARVTDLRQLRELVGGQRTQV